MRLPPLATALLSLLLTAACASTKASREAPAVTPIAPPQPTVPDLNAYYPDASKRAKEVGRVIVHFIIGPAGVPEEPITINEKQSTSYLRLLDATRKIFRRLPFQVSDAYKRDVTASVVFEIAPCGNILHADNVDYRMNLCLELPPPMPQTVY